MQMPFLTYVCFGYLSLVRVKFNYWIDVNAFLFMLNNFLVLVHELLKLGFGKCKLAVQVSKRTIIVYLHIFLIIISKLS